MMWRMDDVDDGRRWKVGSVEELSEGWKRH